MSKAGYLIRSRQWSEAVKIDGGLSSTLYLLAEHLGTNQFVLQIVLVLQSLKKLNLFVP